MMMMTMIATALRISIEVQILCVAKLTANTQADPLLLSRSLGAYNRFAHLDIAGLKMCTRVHCLLLDILNRRLLLHNRLVEVLKQLLQLDQLTFDLLDRVVSLLHISQRRLSLPTAIGIEEGLLKYLCVLTAFGRFPNFCISRVGADNEILAALLLLNFFTELRFRLLIRVDRFPYPPVERFDLRFVARRTRVWLRLDATNTIRKAAVAGHDVRTQAVDLPVGCACTARELPLQTLELWQSRFQIIDRSANGTAIIEYLIWILGGRRAGLRVRRLGRAGEGLHLDVRVALLAVAVRWVGTTIALAVGWRLTPLAGIGVGLAVARVAVVVLLRLNHVSFAILRFKEVRDRFHVL